MNEQTELWQFLTRLSPFLIPVASAVVALLIRDLLDQRHWQRLVRKTFVAAFFGILVFAVLAFGCVILLLLISNDEFLVILLATIIFIFGVIPVSAAVSVWAFKSIEPDLDRYADSRFAYSFRNGSWPTLSVNVRSECLPEGVTFITGRIVASRDSVGKYHLRVAVGYRSGATISNCRTTWNQRHGWEMMMRAVVEAQVLAHREGPKWQKWQERILFFVILGKLFRGCARVFRFSKTLFRRSRFRGNPERLYGKGLKIPAFAGMTEKGKPKDPGGRTRPSILRPSFKWQINAYTHIHSLALVPSQTCIVR